MRKHAPRMHSALLVIGLAAALLLGPGGPQPSGAEPGRLVVTVNGLPLDTPSALVGETIYLPLFPLGDALHLTWRLYYSKSRGTLILNDQPVTATLEYQNGALMFPLIVLEKAGHFEALVSRTNGTVAIFGHNTPTDTPTPTPTPTATKTPAEGPVTETNGTFQVTVTDVGLSSQWRGYYTPRGGSTYVIVYLTQQNISRELQIYTGRFVLADRAGHAYDYLDSLSNFWLMILKPWGSNFGYLVFEIPQNQEPAHLSLTGLRGAPLTLDISRMVRSER